jgi:hypothetical protein
VGLLLLYRARHACPRVRSRNESLRVIQPDTETLLRKGYEKQKQVVPAAVPE